MPALRRQRMSSRTRATTFGVLLASTSMLALSVVAHAQVGVEVVHAFPSPGPVGQMAPLIQATDGNFYGTTTRGGIDDCGTVFRMTASGVVTVLHAFSGADGKMPMA